MRLSVALSSPGRWGLVCNGMGLTRGQTQIAVALRHRLLHHARWNVVPHREQRHAHSLNRDIDSTACNRAADSPMPTLPTTTLTLGQDAVLQRSSAAPSFNLPQPHGNAPQSYFGGTCGPRADYFARFAVGANSLLSGASS
jgi:hypothetical protein